MRVKPRDLKQGKTFWEVSVYVDADGSVDARPPQTLYILSRPYLSAYTKSEFVSASSYYDLEHYETERSLHDLNVIQNHYNLHALFKTKKSADRYVKRMASKCFTPHERAVYNKRVEEAVMDDEVPDYWVLCGACDDAEDETYALPY